MEINKILSPGDDFIMSQFINQSSENRGNYDLLLELMGTNNFFKFRRDYITSGLLGIKEAVFLQDLINLSSLPHTKRGVDGFFLCTREFLHDSLEWSRNDQDKFTKLLKRKGLISLDRRGIPPQRYVKINVTTILTKLTEAKEKKHQNEDNQLSSSADNQLSSNEDNRISANEDNLTMKKKYKKNTSYSSSFEKEAPREISRGAMSDALFETTEKESLNGKHPVEQESPALVLAKRYYTFLSSKNKLPPLKQIRRWRTTWRDSFADLLLISPVERILAVLDWYENHWEDQYTPRRFTAITFCNDFRKIEASYERDPDNKSINIYRTVYFEDPSQLFKGRPIKRPTKETKTIPAKQLERYLDQGWNEVGGKS